MCGIASIFFKNRIADSKLSIQKMTDLMSHRGPDAQGHYIDDHIALGHRRLSIIDLSESGRQPMWDASDRFAIIFNGEIYNYKELKSELSDYPFRSTSDTEVILAGFIRWGIKIFERLNGIFALIIYDKLEKSIHVARDRFGIKPLYYYQNADAVYFSSEQRAIIKSAGLAKKASERALRNYLLNGYVSGTAQICEEVFELEAGHYMCIKQGGQLETKPYHLFFQKKGDLDFQDLQKVRANLQTLLYSAVQRQLVSDVPLGAFLSGGIDSSAIVGIMSKVSDSRPLTFSIGFEEKAFDESNYASDIAKKYNTIHTNITLNPNDFLQELPLALKSMDTPTLDGINTFVVSKLTRNAGITVALSGLGGDELFAGYPAFSRYHNLKKHLFWHLPLAIRQIIGLPTAKMGFSSRLRRIGNLVNVPQFEIENVYPILRAVLDESLVSRLLKNHSEPNYIHTYLQQYQKEIQQFPTLSQYSIAEMSGYTQQMLLKDTDQMSMASSLEVRVPFFDNDLVDYVLNIPDSIKYPHTPKQLLVSALGDMLPQEIVNRPKMGFTLPWKNWLKKDLFDFANSRIRASCDRNILNPDAVQRLWKDFQHDKNNVQWSHVWMIVVLEEWLQQNLG